MSQPMTPPPFNLAAFLAEEVPAIREREDRVYCRECGRTGGLADLPRLLEAVEALQALLGECERGLEFYASETNYRAGSAKGQTHISRVEQDEWGSQARTLLARLRSARGEGKESP